MFALVVKRLFGLRDPGTVTFRFLMFPGTLPSGIRSDLLETSTRTGVEPPVLDRLRLSFPSVKPKIPMTFSWGRGSKPGVNIRIMVITVLLDVIVRTGGRCRPTRPTNVQVGLILFRLVIPQIVVAVPVVVFQSQ